MPLSLQSLFSVAGRRVLLTGGGRGIGKMLASGLVANGAHVVIASRDEAALAATVSECGSSNAEGGGSCVALTADVSSRRGCEQLAADYAALGGEGAWCDVLINNSGASWGEVTLDSLNVVVGDGSAVLLPCSRSIASQAR